jgi:3-(3-hydroxy-phenyl)propionate hydroxylase
MDDEIQRVFQHAGLIDELRSITTPMVGAEFVRPDGSRIVGVEMPVEASWPLGHHPTVAYYQPTFEAFLRGAASDAGVELWLGHDAGDVRQHATGVQVVATAPDGTTSTHRATWLVAADGAASPIRKQLGIRFVDQGFDQDWLVLDVELTRPVPELPRWVQQICDPVRPVTFVTGHADYRRWEFQLLPGETREEMVAPARVWELIEPWLTPDDAVLVRAVVYRFHATVAERMRAGRVFLAGDSAHQMPPFLGQGLCSGIRDAVNLAWKLELVATGRASDELLDTYGIERLPHAADTVAHAVATGKLIDHLSRSSDVAGLDAGYGGGRKPPRLEHGLIAGHHPMVGRQLPQPSVDGRPLDDLLGDGYAVLVRTVDVARPVLDRLEPFGRVVVVPDGTLHQLLTSGGAIVVRPDRYIAAVVDAGELADAFELVLPPVASEPSVTQR